VLKPLTADAMRTIVQRAVDDTERGLGAEGVSIDDDAVGALARYANGDARVALNLLDTAAGTLAAGAGERRITLPLIAELTQNRALLYDKTGEEHYNLISALHKSMRNSDADASVYWLARMLEAGEDPLYVARRLVRFASEDVGNADPHALSVAVAAKEAVHFIGLPEGNTALAQAAIYLARAPKSNAVYVAYLEAADAAKHEVAEPVPLHLRNAPTPLMKQLDYGKGYKYAHDEPAGIAEMECLPPAHKGRKFYRPSGRGDEREP
jgi:putative ATPase